MPWWLRRSRGGGGVAADGAAGGRPRRIRPVLIGLMMQLAQMRGPRPTRLGWPGAEAAGVGRRMCRRLPVIAGTPGGARVWVRGMSAELLGKARLVGAMLRSTWEGSVPRMASSAMAGFGGYAEVPAAGGPMGMTMLMGMGVLGRVCRLG